MIYTGFTKFFNTNSYDYRVPLRDNQNSYLAWKFIDVSLIFISYSVVRWEFATDFKILCKVSEYGVYLLLRLYEIVHPASKIFCSLSN